MDRQYQLPPKGGQAACLGLLSLTKAADIQCPAGVAGLAAEHRQMEANGG